MSIVRPSARCAGWWSVPNSSAAECGASATTSAIARSRRGPPIPPSSAWMLAAYSPVSRGRCAGELRALFGCLEYEVPDRCRTQQLPEAGVVELELHVVGL